MSYLQLSFHQYYKKNPAVQSVQNNLHLDLAFEMCLFYNIFRHILQLSNRQPL